MLLSDRLAINKPKSISSAQVLRELQKAFNPSKLFAPWLEAEAESRARLNKTQRRRRKDKFLQVKLGHGGTLDPMATGVLIVGVGSGTKYLQRFLKCTKSYEATVLFGAATDTYDILGKVLSKAPYCHVTEESVEEALQHFRGKIMQRPPIYSALRVQGKRLYEYAREGLEVPIEIQKRPVEVEELDIMRWLREKDHSYVLPVEEAPDDEKRVAVKVLHLDDVTIAPAAIIRETAKTQDGPALGSKRKWELNDDHDVVAAEVPPLKRQDDLLYTMSGGLPCLDEPKPISPTSFEHEPPIVDIRADEQPLTDERPPAVKLRMTVASGFYVRSLSHDLGKKVGSLGLMSELVRTRQGNFRLGQNVLEYEDISKGEEIWAPKVQQMLEEWQTRTLSDD